MSDEVYTHFKERRDAQKAKRALNRASSPELLKSKGIPFEVHNDGAHIRINLDPGFVDFWPGTGLWIDRGTGKRGRGVFHLIGYYDKVIGVPVTSSGG